MSDCPNVEMRELLPELLNGRLDDAVRVRVEAHVASCAECSVELGTLRSVRSAFAAGRVLAADVDHIVRALPRPADGVRSERRVAGPGRPQRKWVDWRVAAALTMVTVGALSVAVSRRGPQIGGPHLVGADTPAVAPNDSVPRVASPRSPARVDSEPRTGRRSVQLSFGGGVRDLEAADIEALLGALDEIDAGPVAPAAEPDHAPALPVVTGESR